MDISLDSIIALAGLFIGGGGGAFFTWRWQRKKAEADAAKDVQDVYQQMVADVKADTSAVVITVFVLPSSAAFRASHFDFVLLAMQSSVNTSLT